MMSDKPNKLSYNVYKGDNRKLLQKHVQPGQARLAIADPPYNLGMSYEAYQDNKPVKEYLDWTRQWLTALLAVLHKHGSLWIFINDGLVSELDMICKSEFKLWKRSHVIWHYTFGQNTSANFTPSHTHLLYYARTKSKFTFHKDDEDLRHLSARQFKYKDKRANPAGRLPDNTWVIFPELLPEAFDPAGDTWLSSRICGTFDEREEHSPNQIPIPLMERIVRATSSPGDLVVDPFCGSGSSGVAAKLLGRSYVGIDLSDTACKQSRQRIANAKPLAAAGDTA
jgi:DNA modification methylase